MSRSPVAAARDRVVMRLETVSLLVLGAAVAAAPWLTAPISPARTELVEIILGLGVGLWFGALLLGRRLPGGPFGAVVGVTLALGWGWFLAVNARTSYDPLTLRLVERSQMLAGWPGSVDRRTSVTVLGTLTVLALGTVALVDLCRRAGFRRMLLWALAWNGAVLGILGTLDRFGSGPVTFSQLPGEGSHFGPFGYHASAAAYLNLCLPAGVALAVASTGTKRRIAVGLAAATTLGCVFHVSKAGLVLTAVLVAALRLRLRGQAGPGIRNGHRARVSAFVLIAGAGFVANLARWREAAAGPNSFSARFAAWRVTASVWQDAAGGVGPGGFKIVFPAEVTNRNPGLFRQWVVTPWRPGRPTGMWMNVHNDPLQFLVEWGVPGAVFAGFALFCVVRALRPASGRPSPVLIACQVALGVVGLHALIDFPLQVLAVQLGVSTWLAVGIPEARRGRPPPRNLAVGGDPALRSPLAEVARR